MSYVDGMNDPWSAGRTAAMLGKPSTSNHVEYVLGYQHGLQTLAAKAR